MLRFSLFHSHDRKYASRLRSPLGVLVLLVLCFPPEQGIPLPGLRAVLADDEPDEATEEEFDIEEAERKTRRRSSTRTTRPVVNNFAGVNGRIGHIAFPTFGRHDSISHVELFPFLIDDNNMIFGNARVFTDNGWRFGANGGAGLRRWIPAWERALGASVWYDFDEGSGESFQALGLSLESYGEFFDFRSNGYLPIGDRKKDDYERISNTRYVGNQIVFDYLRKFSEAQTGFDVELGIAVPSQFAADRNMRLVGGYYHFLGDDVADIDGYKARIEGRLLESIDLQVELTDDNTFGTNVNFGVAYHFGGSSSEADLSDKKLRRMTRYVNRNYNIIVSKGYDSSHHRPAINPSTGEAYVVQHVSTAIAQSGSGTAESPVRTIAEAQASSPDVIFVHSGSVLGDPAVLAPGQRVLGEGVDHVINAQGVGNILLPRYTTGTALPVLQGVPGNAVILASGSEFSGFLIDGPAGSGIIGSGINGATIRNVTIQNAAGEGIFLSNSNGQFLFENVNLAGTAGTAFHVDGGASNISMSGAIHNAANRAVLIENTAGGTIDLVNASVLDVGGTGILLANNGGNVNFGNVQIENSSTAGIDVQGGTGTAQFTQQTTVVNSAGPGINIQNAGGTTNFNNVSVTNTTGADGVRIVDSPGTTTIVNLNATTQGGTGLFALNNGTLGIGAGVINSTNASAVDIENTTMNIQLTSVSSSGAVNGIRIVDSPGAFLVLGTGSDGSGGLIQGATVGVLAENSGAIALQSMHLDGNTTGLMATGTESVEFYLGRITNSAGDGIDLLNVRNFELYGSALAGNGGHSVRGRFDAVADYNYNITQNTIDNGATSPIVLTTLPSGEGSTLSLAIEKNAIAISAAGSRALDLDWNGELLASLAENAILGTGDSNAGFDINTSSTTEPAQIAIGQNVLTFGGTNSVGIGVTTSGPAQIAIGHNTLVFNAANGIGADLAIGPGSTVDFFSNAFTDNASRGTGLLFSSITGVSAVAINNNNFQLLSADALVDRGIIFDTVTGDVHLTGTHNNVVNGAATPFSTVGTTGQIFVNGVLVP